jgi:hypothetical protein
VVAATVNAKCGNATGPYLTILSSNYDAAARPLVATYGNGIVATAGYSVNRPQLTSLNYTINTTTLFGLTYYYQQDSMYEEASINLENLTYPLAHAAAALNEVTTDISFIKTEEREGHSVYRLRLKGPLGLGGRTSSVRRVSKDLLIDAENFNILAVEDRPFPNRSTNEPDAPSRTIEYADFRTVNGLRIPLSITTKLMGQTTMSMTLTRITFNDGLSPADFKQ